MQMWAARKSGAAHYPQIFALADRVADILGGQRTGLDVIVNGHRAVGVANRDHVVDESRIPEQDGQITTGAIRMGIVFRNDRSCGVGKASTCPWLFT